MTFEFTPFEPNVIDVIAGTGWARFILLDPFGLPGLGGEGHVEIESGQRAKRAWSVEQERLESAQINTARILGQ